MKIAPLPPDEQSRLACLYKYDILDTEAEKDFDDIVQLASRVCQTEISLISLIDEHRQWFKARLGVENHETPRDPAFCAHALFSDEIMIVPDARKDDRFFDNPFVTGSPNIRFYAGMPLTMDDGSRLGTLCVIDHEPRKLNEDQKSCLRILGKQVVNLLELRLKNKEVNQALHTVEQQKENLQKLNEAGNRLLSVIGHDLRSPFATLCALLELYEADKMSQEEFLDIMKAVRLNTHSALDLLNDLLVWAEDQFTNSEIHTESILLNPLVNEVIRDQRALLKRKGYQAVNLVPGDCQAQADRNALAFMLRNLLINANKFTENGTIKVQAEISEQNIRISVVDSGIGMSRPQLDKLFDPTSRSSTHGTRGEKGSGLGLQLCKEFAKRHGGCIGAESEPGKGSRFYFTLERNPHPAGQNGEKTA